MISAETEAPRWMERLNLPAYRPGLAAKCAQISTQSVAYWRRGAAGRPRPVLASTRTDTLLSYLELIELAFVASMRQMGIPFAKIRRTREYAQKELGSEHPFSEYAWKTNGMHLLLGLHEVDPSLDVDRLIIGDSYGQLTWHGLVDDRFTEFDYENDFVVRWHPRGKTNSVIIDPRIRFGAPNAGGVLTGIIKDRYDAGETLSDLVDDFQLEEQLLRDALAFEGTWLQE